jgi:hypothetical protein
MPDEPILFDEWHLVWQLDPGATIDAEQLRAELNRTQTTTAIEQAIREVVRQSPSLRPLTVTIAK